MSTAKSEYFYIEFVVLTIISLVATQLWIRYVTKVVDKYSKGSMTFDLVSAIVATLFAMFIIKTFFNDTPMMGAIGVMEE